MKPSEALKIAREKILSEQVAHICNALPKNDAGDIVRDYIKQAIYPYYTYGSWLYANLLEETSYDDRKEARIQWIDWMTSEYKKIGQ